MTSETRDRISRSLLILICFTVYLSLVTAVAAHAFGTSVYEFLLG
jgi:hypothetical protein